MIYCKGLPLALSTHSCRSFRRAAQLSRMFPVLRCGSATKSLSHRSSFFADVRSRVARSTNGSNGSLLCAWCKTRGCRRGIAERQGCCYCSFSRQTSLRKLMLLSQRKRALRECLCFLGIRASVSDAGQAFTQAMPSSRSNQNIHAFQVTSGECSGRLERQLLNDSVILRELSEHCCCRCCPMPSVSWAEKSRMSRPLPSSDHSNLCQTSRSSFPTTSPLWHRTARHTFVPCVSKQIEP